MFYWSVYICVQKKLRASLATKVHCHRQTVQVYTYTQISLRPHTAGTFLTIVYVHGIIYRITQ